MVNIVFPLSDTYYSDHGLLPLHIICSRDVYEWTLNNLLRPRNPPFKNNFRIRRSQSIDASTFNQTQISIHQCICHIKLTNAKRKRRRCSQQYGGVHTNRNGNIKILLSLFGQSPQLKKMPRNKSYGQMIPVQNLKTMHRNILNFSIKAFCVNNPRSYIRSRIFLEMRQNR